MSKKHFIALADALRSTKPTSALLEQLTQWESDVEAVARVCGAFNPAFDRTRWFGYVHGPNGGAKP